MPPKIVGQPTSLGGKPAAIELKAPVPEVKPLPDVNMPANPAEQRNPIFNMPGSGNKDQPKKPFRLSADEIVAFVTTLGTKKQLQELVAEGDVRVLQDGETPKDKGVDIIGDMLNLIYHPLGNRLWVLGTRRSAQLQVGELTLIGPKVDIDQKDNTAAVDGIGSMKMPSNTSFDGGKPAKEGAVITIHWNKDMLFNGKFAEFHGGVLAYQDNARLKCQTMQVTLDRFVSFKTGQKDKENAKVEKLVCDQRVWVEDETIAPDGKRLTYKRLIGSALDMDNPEGRFIAPGPGLTIHIAKGSDDLTGAGAPAAAPKKDAANPKQDQKPMTTIVKFDGRMFGSQKQGGPKIAIFYDNVEVHHQPGEDPDVKVDADRPPKDGFYMRCNNLNVSTIERDGKSFQYMVARNNAFFRTPEFYGSADVIKYDQSQELVIFEGENGNTTKLYKLRAPGAKPQLIEGRRIVYNRKTATFILDGGKEIRSRLETGKNGAVDRTAVGALNGKPGVSFIARLDLDRKHEEFFGLGLIPRHDRQVFAAHRAVDDLALFRRGDGEADAILLVGAVLDDNLGRHVVH
jgi:lipopolysaccharide export system protein LptA